MSSSEVGRVESKALALFQDRPEEEDRLDMVLVQLGDGGKHRHVLTITPWPAIRHAQKGQEGDGLGDAKHCAEEAIGRCGVTGRCGVIGP